MAHGPQGAGTESKVYLEMHGSHGKIGPVHLDNPAAFERGATDTFIVDGSDLGQLIKLVVTCDGSGMRPLWHLDSITVWRDPLLTDPEAGVYFPSRCESGGVLGACERGCFLSFGAFQPVAG